MISFPTEWMVVVERQFCRDAFDVFVYRYLSADRIEFQVAPYGVKTIETSPIETSPHSMFRLFEITGPEFASLETYKPIEDQIRERTLAEAIAHHEEQLRYLRKLRGTDASR